MSSFTEPLTVTKVEDRIWVTAREFRYYIGEEGSNEYVDVPEGFATDFASVPRPLWSLYPPDGQYTQASVLHDWLYKVKIFTRKKSDDIFLEAMGVLKVPWMTRHVMYRSVRLFGWIAWRK